MKTPDKLDPMPAAFPAMWRALVRAREAEPLLLAVSFSLALLAALPDALLALWLSLLAGRRSCEKTRSSGRCFDRIGSFRCCYLDPACHQRSHPASFSRAPYDYTRGPRSPPPGFRRQH
jgi:hypothetical protein